MAEVELPNPHEAKEHAADPFTRAVALCVAVYAVGLAVASFGGHNAAKEMMMAKQEESNQWARYQSKATREALARNELMKLDSERDAAGALPPAKQALYEKLAADEKRMQADKKEIEDGDPEHHTHGARQYQAEVKLMQRKDPYFDFAEVVFQIAIVLASVAMLSGKRWAFATSGVLAGVALLLTMNGFALAVAVPGLDAGAGQGRSEVEVGRSGIAVVWSGPRRSRPCPPFRWSRRSPSCPTPATPAAATTRSSPS